MFLLYSSNFNLTPIMLTVNFQWKILAASKPMCPKQKCSHSSILLFFLLLMLFYTLLLLMASPFQNNQPWHFKIYDYSLSFTQHPFLSFHPSKCFPLPFYSLPFHSHIFCTNSILSLSDFQPPLSNLLCILPKYLSENAVLLFWVFTLQVSVKVPPALNSAISEKWVIPKP